MPSWMPDQLHVYVTVPAEDPGRPVTLAVTGLQNVEVGGDLWRCLIPPPAMKFLCSGAFCPGEICVSPRMATLQLLWAPVPVFDQPHSK